MKRSGRLVGLLCLSLILTSCAGLQSKVHGEGGLTSVEGQGGLLGGGSAPVEKGSYSDTLDGEVLGQKLKNKNFDIPVVYNNEVDQWMRFFTGRGREHFEIYLERMGAMLPLIRPALKEANMPEDLIYLAMIESGFSTQAKSRAGAVGPWQFIRSTGRIYDMRIDSWVDERRDPFHATQAAIRYLGNLYEEFGDWELAAAAYNSGEIRIRNAIRKYGTRDFWTIARARHALKKETKNYVPKMMAAAILAKNAELYGFKFPEPDAKWLNTTDVSVPKAEDLRSIAKIANIEAADLRTLNPELVHACTPPGESYQLRIPKESKDLVQKAIDNGELGRFENFRRHTVHKGDSLAKIARRYKVDKEVILALNDLNGPQSLRLNQELVVPGPAIESVASREPPRIIASHSRHKQRFQKVSLLKNDGAVIYTVQKGDTLYDISRKYSVSVGDIKDWNEISRSKNLQPGRRLKLYVRNETPRI